MNNEIINRILSSIILIPVALYFILKGSIFFNFFISVCFLITVYEWHNMTNKKPYNIFGLIFLILSFYSIYNLRHAFEGDYLYLLFITIICVSTDIGGYIFGKIFKGPKLIKISPKKTYSGTIGGYFLSIIAINYYLSSSYVDSSIDFSKEIFIFVILVSTVSQLGDIIISYFKRKSKIKDTGKIIPGHGGLLDRIDGMVFAFPFSYIIILTGIISIF
ncbi:phosphatidate cytidylyltransferase [Candidatus Pelagibacter bacterium nBUS_32]|jgi:phosphatidate cytidylyltransferase|uniref:phosphatidate cytidylyltransferase n=1 Tax=Candidatus Pelagibacter bacterium nBUS_32 TaxID=3374192 RepID=UPI003EB99412